MLKEIRRIISIRWFSSQFLAVLVAEVCEFLDFIDFVIEVFSVLVELFWRFGGFKSLLYVTKVISS